MKKNMEYIILISIIILLTFILLFGPKHNKNIHYNIPSLPKIERTKIYKIDIANGNKKIELIKINGHWFIAKDKFPVDNRKIDFILDDLTRLNILSLVSTSNDYARYSLDDINKIQIDVWYGNKNKFSFSIGKLSPNYTSTYIKLKSSPYIYMAQGNLKLTFDTDREELMDKKVFSFDKKNIRRIYIKLENKSLNIKKDNNKWIYNNKELEPNNIKKFIEKVNNLECESYLINKSNTLKNNNVYLEVKIDLKDHNNQLIIEKKNKKNTIKYIGKSNLVPYKFIIPSYKIKEIVETINKIDQI